MSSATQAGERPGDLWPDHVNHSVPDLERARDRMVALGFLVTPRSDQLAPDADGKLVRTGMANHCVMLGRGYIELSGAILDDTPAVRGLRDTLARHVGVHLLALGTPDPAFQAERLPQAGFAPATLMNYQRLVEAADRSEQLARFTLAFAPRELVPEARLLTVRHETPELLWQERWLGHPNGVTGLQEVVYAAADLPASVERLSRYVGVEPQPGTIGMALPLARGRLSVLPAGQAAALFAPLPGAPCTAGYVLGTDDLDALVQFLKARSVALSGQGAGWLAVAGGEALGSHIYFAEPGAKLPWH
ncbi:VOC family protein [Bosea minatitlanensis]|uniref:VOC family protein n=1 Tax=Bosea minatitlanensis TaxID=128782 RepID=A0ABW0F5E9_9HYPH|nr:VOC family protein [Bosea minatitlanensis]MCT4493394.1 VOC family protein [Bosea minatitlanensis]